MRPRLAILAAMLLASMVPLTKAKAPSWREQTEAWVKPLQGRTFYLRDVQLPLLMNDEVRVVAAAIRKNASGYYVARLTIEGRPPAPKEQVEFKSPSFVKEEQLHSWILTLFSSTPLENAYNWPGEIKRAVRSRFIGLGMSPDMVRLALGGLGYQLDLEQLEDGRVRETWKLQVEGDTRSVFTSRVVVGNSRTHSTVQAFGTSTTIDTGMVSSSSSTARASGTSETNSKVVESGFYLFGGLPPQFLHIVFTDGKVTARRTEFVE